MRKHRRKRFVWADDKSVGDENPFTSDLLAGIAAAIAAFILASFGEWAYYNETIHLRPFVLAKDGLLVGVVLAVGLVACFASLLKSSSNRWQSLLKCFKCSCFLPIVGICLVSDLNRAMDTSAPDVVDYNIRDLDSELSGSRFRGQRRIYYLYLQPTRETETDLPSGIQISKDVYQRLQGHKGVQISISRGFLGHEWIRDIVPKD